MLFSLQFFFAYDTSKLMTIITLKMRLSWSDEAWILRECDHSITFHLSYFQQFLNLIQRILLCSLTSTCRCHLQTTHHYCKRIGMIIIFEGKLQRDSKNSSTLIYTKRRLSSALLNNIAIHSGESRCTVAWVGNDTIHKGCTVRACVAYKLVNVYRKITQKHWRILNFINACEETCFFVLYLPVLQYTPVNPAVQLQK